MNRKLGPVRTRGEADGLTRAEAEQAFRRVQAEEASRKPVDSVVEIVTVDQAADRLRKRIAIEGARLSYRQNCGSMQRVHVSPTVGKRKVAAVTTEGVERLASRMLARGSSPKTVRNVMTLLRSVFGPAVKKGWAPSNPVEDAARPKRRPTGDADPDLQFLTPAELDRVFGAIPDRTVDKDALGPVVRLIVMAGTTGLRQSELLGLRWRDVDMRARRVRDAWVRYEHSGEGKSDLSTKRSVPLTDRMVRELKRWRLRTVYGDDEDLVFAHPELGVPLDRTKVTRKFQAACHEAGVRSVRFQDLRHTFATTLAAAAVPLRTIQESLGHADLKTTQIYAHYAPSTHEVEIVNHAFGMASQKRRRRRSP